MELGCTTIGESVIPKMGGGRNGEAMLEEEGGYCGSGCCLEKNAQHEVGGNYLPRRVATS